MGLLCWACQSLRVFSLWRIQTSGTFLNAILWKKSDEFLPKLVMVYFNLGNKGIPLQVLAIQQYIARPNPGLEAEKMKMDTWLCRKWDFVTIWELLKPIYGTLNWIVWCKTRKCREFSKKQSTHSGGHYLQKTIHWVAISWHVEVWTKFWSTFQIFSEGLMYTF